MAINIAQNTPKVNNYFIIIFGPDLQKISYYSRPQ